MCNWFHVQWFPARKARRQFEGIMDMAQRIAERHPPALIDLARLLGRTIQTDRIAHLVLEPGEHTPLPHLNFDQAFFDRSFPLTVDGRGFFALSQIHVEERDINLARDVVLPWPWRRDRFANTLSHIGAGKRAGAWRQQEWNHKIEWWVPIGIGWVEGGNHSISAGIVQGEGIVRVHGVRSIHSVYEHVLCDGTYFRRAYDREKICRVSSPEFAGLFEIGRLMLHYGVSA